MIDGKLIRYTLIAYKENKSYSRCSRGCCGSDNFDSDFVFESDLTFEEVTRRAAELHEAEPNRRGDPKKPRESDYQIEIVPTIISAAQAEADTHHAWSIEANVIEANAQAFADQENAAEAFEATFIAPLAPRIVGQRVVVRAERAAREKKDLDAAQAKSAQEAAQIAAERKAADLKQLELLKAKYGP